MAPLKLFSRIIASPRDGHFHPFTGMAPLKPSACALYLTHTAHHFHPFTGMAPLKHLGVNAPFLLCVIFPSLHRDGPIEALPLSIPGRIWPGFHPFTGMAPLKLLGCRFIHHFQNYFHPFTGMAPLKLQRAQAGSRIGAISIPSQGWPH